MQILQGWRNEVRKALEMTQNRKKRSTIKGLLLFSAGCCIIAALLLLFITVYKLENITVEGLTYYTEEEFISKLSGSAAQKNALLFRLRTLKDGVRVIPYIESYEVTMKDNHTIQIQVYEKILVGCVKIMGQYLYFDKDGLVTESSTERLPEVPLVKGLEFDRIVLHEKLEIQKDELYDTILNLTKSVREYEIPADTITFNSRGEVELEVGNITVELGKRQVYERSIQKLADIYPSVAERRVIIDLSEFDGGDGDIIAKPKKD